MLPLCGLVPPRGNVLCIDRGCRGGRCLVPSLAPQPTLYSADRDAEQVSRQFCEIKAELEEAAPAASPLSPQKAPTARCSPPQALPTAPQPQQHPQDHELLPVPTQLPSVSRQAGTAMLQKGNSTNSPSVFLAQIPLQVPVLHGSHASLWPRCVETRSCWHGQDSHKQGSAAPLGWGAQHGQSSTRLHQTTSALLRSSHQAPTSARRARSTPALLLRLQDHGQVARAHIICGLMDETTGWEENTYSATIYQGQKLEHN